MRLLLMAYPRVPPARMSAARVGVKIEEMRDGVAGLLSRSLFTEEAIMLISPPSIETMTVAMITDMKTK